jgi:hypothetical protein
MMYLYIYIHAGKMFDISKYNTSYYGSHFWVYTFIFQIFIHGISITTSNNNFLNHRFRLMNLRSFTHTQQSLKIFIKLF